MGRQHTIYLSDDTWNEMLELKRDDETMSAVIRTAIHTCAVNKGQFDLIVHQTKMIEAMKRRIASITNRICTPCHTDLFDKGLID
tara:strand:- start:436 stop:690 length:255 start_codon:yes stop_codon:yes gene_type:complete